MSGQKLKYHSNVCAICLICLKCDKFYGNLCSCEEITMHWSRKVEESKKFRTKTLLQESTKRNSNFDTEFITWFWENIPSNLEVCSNQPSVNICKKCLNRYDYYKRKNKKANSRAEETIILLSTPNSTPKSTPIKDTSKFVLKIYLVHLFILFY